MLELLSGDPVAYQEYARRYYESDPPIEAIKQIYAHKPLNDELVRALNVDLTVGGFAAETIEIGYPDDAI